VARFSGRRFFLLRGKGLYPSGYGAGDNSTAACRKGNVRGRAEPKAPGPVAASPERPGRPPRRPRVPSRMSPEPDRWRGGRRPLRWSYSYGKVHPFRSRSNARRIGVVVNNPGNGCKNSAAKYVLRTGRVSLVAPA